MNRVPSVRRRAERALQENEQRYRILAEASPDALFLCDRQGRLCYINSSAARFLGRPAGEIVGKQQTDIFPNRRGQRHIRAIQRVFRTGRPSFTPDPERLPGTDRWVDTRLVPIRNSRGRVIFVLGLARDITARVKAEQALREREANFRAIGENAVDGLIIATAPNRWIFVNQRMAEISGYSVRELQHMDVRQLATARDAKRVQGFMERRLRGETVPQRYESALRRKNGTFIPIEISAAQTVWRGQPAVMAIVRNIQAQRQMEIARRRLARRLIQIQEKERKSISTALHDHLGQLLTLTRLEIGAVQARDTSSRRNLFKALRHLDETLAAVRDLASSLRPPILDDLSFATALEELAREFNAGRALRVSFSAGGAAPRLSRDRKLCLYRIMQEALSNATRHAGARRIRCRLETSDEETQLVIADNGRGFDPNAPKNNGGIGLLGMKERMLQCGGTLEVQSSRGEGTTVIASLPARRSRSRRKEAP